MSASIGRGIEVADGDDRHQVGSIPVGVELLQAIVRKRADDLGLADRQALGVARVLEQHGQLHVQHPRAWPEPRAPLLQDDAALLVDLLGIERDGVRPVLQDEERPIDHARVVGGNLQLVDRLVEARVGVDVRTEAHACRLQERDDVLFREVARAVEAHVLDEVREPPLVVVLENRSGVDHEPELGATLRLLVDAEVIAQAVGKRADGNARIDGNGSRQRNVLRPGRDGALRARHNAGTCRERQRQEHQGRAGAKDHERHHFTSRSVLGKSSGCTVRIPSGAEVEERTDGDPPGDPACSAAMLDQGHRVKGDHDQSQTDARPERRPSLLHRIERVRGASAHTSERQCRSEDRR